MVGKLDRKTSELSHKSFEVLSIFTCILAILTMFVFGFTVTNYRNLEQKARTTAKVIGYSAWQIELDKADLENNIKPIHSIQRGLASLESNNEHIWEIGKDPWGKPFIINTKKSQQIMYVWSRGANGKNESIQNLPTFGGDDIGYVLDLKARN